MQIERTLNENERLNYSSARDVEEEWEQLLSNIKQQMNKGVHPQDPTVKQLAKRWKQLDEHLSLGGLEVSEIIKNDSKEPFNYKTNSYDDRIEEYISLALVNS